MEKQLRLNKFLAERLGISRREADDLIARGKITLDDKVATLGARINLPGSENAIDKFSEVCYNGRIRELSAVQRPQSLQAKGDKVLILPGVEYIYLALNKPVGYVCSRRTQDEAPTIYQLLPEKYQELKTVGRLDKDSSGLILLTNDGDFAFRMTHPKFTKTKVYEVELDRALEPLHQQMIADFGIELGDGVSRLGLERKDNSRRRWRVVMSEGRNRQIRRTFGALGYTVVKLHRIEFGPYRLDGLEPGKFVEVQKA